MDRDANRNQNEQNEELIKSIFDGITFTPINTEIPQQEQPPSFVETPSKNVLECYTDVATKELPYHEHMNGIYVA
ncbi:20854_t:CDS:2 [Gigaspora margarita]|uniref:20854_t:CDS:1 n=1 Tax=Gigaspora margarita TaxID=4874 RepID=A0ABM8W137_GIGMA|nr:20854_t:CDS:2 [Gigaspora margarita]